MITYKQAFKEILKNVQMLPVKEIPLEESLGMILQEDVFSGIDMPPFDKSAMDGYALKHLDIKKVPIRLKCIGLCQAGSNFSGDLKNGECIKIMTGAPLPKGADCVVMVEYTRSSGEIVEILKRPKKGEHVFSRGEYFKLGQKVIKKGKEISSSDIALLAAIGKRSIKAAIRPRVAILNTGSEIVKAGKRLGKNKIYNSNGPLLEALLISSGIRLQVLGAVEDNATKLRNVISKGLKSDILLISGGVSMGDYDLVPDVLCSLGVKKIFHKVKIKPGKPIFFGTKNRTLIFGIPGNPVSTFVSYLVFIRTGIQKMMGCLNPEVGFRKGIVESKFSKNTGRCYFAFAKISKREGRYYLSPIPGHGSGDTLSLSKSDGFAILDDKVMSVKKGSKIEFITWKII